MQTLRLPRFRLRTLLVVVALVGMGVVPVQQLLIPGISVAIINETNSPLNQIRVAYPGGVRLAERIEPGARVTWRIRPLGESNISLAYGSVKGRRFVKADRVYVEKNYRGSVHFHVGRDGVRVQHYIWIVPFLR